MDTVNDEPRVLLWKTFEKRFMKFESRNHTEIEC